MAQVTEFCLFRFVFFWFCFWSKKFLCTLQEFFESVVYFFLFNSMPTLNCFALKSDDAVYLEYQRLSSDDLDGKMCL